MFVDINMAFHQAARNVLIDDESLLQRFHLGVQVKGTDKSKSLFILLKCKGFFGFY
jgi:hypothetical protein